MRPTAWGLSVVSAFENRCQPGGGSDLPPQLLESCDTVETILIPLNLVRGFSKECSRTVCVHILASTSYGQRLSKISPMCRVINGSTMVLKNTVAICMVKMKVNSPLFHNFLFRSGSNNLLLASERHSK